MNSPEEDKLHRKKRREELLKLQFRDMPMEDQLRLLRDLIGHMEFDLIKSKAASEPSPGETAPQAPPRQVVPPAPPQPTSPAASLPSPKPAPARTDSPVKPPSVQDLPPPEPDWEEFDKEMDEVLQAEGDYHQVHSLRLKDAMDRYADLLKRHGFIKRLPPLSEQARQAREKDLQAKISPTAWSEWVAKDQETLDRPLSHQWDDWLLPGTDEEPRDN